MKIQKRDMNFKSHTKEKKYTVSRINIREDQQQIQIADNIEVQATKHDA